MKKILWLSVFISACTATKQTTTVNPFQGEQVGCGHFIVYKLSEDKKQVISIAMNMADIEVKPSQSYGLDKAEVIEVMWKTYDGDISPSLCNDVRGLPKPGKLNELKARSGIVELIMSNEEAEKMKHKEPYRVSLILRRVTFEGKMIDYLKIQDVNVGWLPG